MSSTFVCPYELFSRPAHLTSIQDGGGWALGNINSEIHIATRMCVNANAVVVKFDYRQAPENPFPAAVEDCWEVMQWIVEDARAPNGGVLGIDEKRMYVPLYYQSLVIASD